MDFYEDMSAYYDDVFPFKTATFEFLKESVPKGEKPGRILDLACGSGNYTLAFSGYADSVTGIDLDPMMIARANEKKMADNVDFSVGNMLEFDQLIAGGEAFDFVYSIGNSIVHLNSLEDIGELLAKVYECLKPGGGLVIQVVNFSRVLSQNITSLPTIKNDEEGIVFVRDYNYDSAKHKVEFKTCLRVERDYVNEQFEGSIDLYPLTYEEGIEVFREAGFRRIEVFGGFDGQLYDKETSYPMIIRGYKE